MLRKAVVVTAKSPLTDSEFRAPGGTRNRSGLVFPRRAVWVVILKYKTVGEPMFLPSIAKRVQGPVDTLCESSHFGFLFFDSLAPFPLSSFHLRWFLGNQLLDTLILYHRESIAAVGDCSLPLVPPHILGLAGWNVFLGFSRSGGVG